MIDPSRFLVSSEDYEKWLATRAGGVTATTVSRAVTPDGFRETLEQVRNPSPFTDNEFMKFGREQEEALIKKLSTKFDLRANNWLISKDSEELRWQMATPDGLSPQHDLIAEVKTTGRDWGDWRNVPGNYHRQVQWQLYVTDATACVFGWMLRKKKSGKMVPGWAGPKYVVVDRDEALIKRLVKVANDLYRELPIARG